MHLQLESAGHLRLAHSQTFPDRQQLMAQLYRLVSARASHQATTPDEDALLYLCVFSLTLRADLEDNRNARFNRALLTSRLVLAPYSTLAPFHLRSIRSACPEANCGCCLCVPSESGSSASESCCRSHLRYCPQLSHVYEYRRHQLRRGN